MHQEFPDWAAHRLPPQRLRFASLPARGDKELRLFLSPCDTPYRFWTMLEDPPYRESVAAQNAGYNQPPQPGFYFGPDLLGHGIWFRGMYLPKWSK